MRASHLVFWCMCASLPLAASAHDASAGKAKPVDVQTLHHKVLCGYQGWFRCPGDGTSDGWLHWSRRSDELTPASLSFEMWPDMAEYGPNERYAVPGFTGVENKPPTLFSSANPRTVQRHFDWMRDYGIDGVFLQRFLVELGRPSLDQVLRHVRQSAAKTGRTYAICYDMSGAKENTIYESLIRDWKRLVEELKVTRDDRYLHHRGRPVLMIWGFFSDRFDAAIAHQLIDFFKTDPKYGATLVGGCQWYWRTEQNAEWSRAFRRFDVLSPWNVGNHTVLDDHKVAATEYWKGDLAEAHRHGFDYLPVIYPGFGWTNLHRNRSGTDRSKDMIDRRQGEFFWEQFVTAAEMDIEMAYVAMFDEVDEATAIFKVTNSPPSEVPFQTYDGLPSDFYLRLTGQGSRVIRREIKPHSAVPR